MKKRLMRKNKHYLCLKIPNLTDWKHDTDVYVVKGGSKHAKTDEVVAVRVLQEYDSLSAIEQDFVDLKDHYPELMIVKQNN